MGCHRGPFLAGHAVTKAADRVPDTSKIIPEQKSTRQDLFYTRLGGEFFLSTIRKQSFILRECDVGPGCPVGTRCFSSSNVRILSLRVAQKIGLVSPESLSTGSAPTEGRSSSDATSAISRRVGRGDRSLILTKSPAFCVTPVNLTVPYEGLVGVTFQPLHSGLPIR